MSRAGLVSLMLLFLYITLAASAPLPELLEERNLSSLKERDFDIADYNYHTREVTAHGDLLYRRRFPISGAPAKQRIKKALIAVKQVFQKGSAAFQKYFKSDRTKSTGAMAKKLGD